MPIPNNENEVGEELKEDDEMEIDEISNENKTNELGEEILPEKIKPKIQNNQSMKDSDCLTKEDNLIEKHTVDGEVVLTHTAERGMDTMFHSMDTTDDNDEIPINNKDFKTFIKNQFNKWVEVNFKIKIIIFKFNKNYVSFRTKMAMDFKTMKSGINL